MKRVAKDHDFLWVQLTSHFCSCVPESFFITYVKEHPYGYAALYESSPEMTVGQVSLMAIWSFAHYGHYAHFV